MEQRGFRFGIALLGAGSGEEWVESARRAESLGYATLVVPDSVSGTLSPLVALAAAAASTETLRLGTYVLATSYRNPVLLAHEAATLDLLSNGRFELGLGAGRDDHDYARLGMSPEPASKRVDRLAETLRLIDPLPQRQQGAATGASSRSPATPRVLRSVRQPRLPILVAGAGRRVLRLAARHADIVTVAAGPTLETFTERLSWVRGAAGERLDDLELNQTLHAVGERVNPRLSAIVGLEPKDAIASGSLYMLMGSPDRMCDELLRRRELYGVSYFTAVGVPMEALAPVIDRLAGR